jgi:hypothetical protein
MKDCELLSCMGVRTEKRKENERKKKLIKKMVVNI